MMNKNAPKFFIRRILCELVIVCTHLSYCRATASVAVFKLAGGASALQLLGWRNQSRSLARAFPDCPAAFFFPSTDFQPLFFPRDSTSPPLPPPPLPLASH